MTPACGCAAAHPGGRRELWFWVFNGLKVRDNGPKTCTIESIQVRADGYNNIETYDPTAKLRRSIRGDETETVSFKCTVETTRGSKADPKILPKNITIDIKFNCKKKQIPKILNRIDDSYKYT